MAYDRKAQYPQRHHADFLPSRSPELNPVENIWQYLRANWLSNRVFETYDAIIDAACDAWRKLIAQPQTITSIGMRGWVADALGEIERAAEDVAQAFVVLDPSGDVALDTPRKVRSSRSALFARLNCLACA